MWGTFAGAKTRIDSEVECKLSVRAERHPEAGSGGYWSKFAHIASSDGRLTLFVLCFLPGSLSLSPRASMMKQHGCLNVPSLDFRQNTLHILTTQEVLALEKNEIQWQ